METRSTGNQVVIRFNVQFQQNIPDTIVPGIYVISYWRLTWQAEDQGKGEARDSMFCECDYSEIVYFSRYCI